LSKLKKEGFNSVCLLIVGDVHSAKYKELISKLIRIKNLDNSVAVLGPIKAENRGIYFELADIVVYPSYYEVWGMVVNEAASLGKPIISTITCAAAYDVLRDYPNSLITPGNVEGLTSGLKHLIISSSLREEIGKKLKSIVNEKYTYKEMFKGFLKAIRLAIVPRGRNMSKAQDEDLVFSLR